MVTFITFSFICNNAKDNVCCWNIYGSQLLRRGGGLSSHYYRSLRSVACVSLYSKPAKNLLEQISINNSSFFFLALKIRHLPTICPFRDDEDVLEPVLCKNRSLTAAAFNAHD
jgi:hypothetical protein